jgi:hypothetical protein
MMAASVFATVDASIIRQMPTDEPDCVVIGDLFGIDVALAHPTFAARSAAMHHLANRTIPMSGNVTGIRAEKKDRDLRLEDRGLLFHVERRGN